MTPSPNAALIDVGNVLLTFDFEPALLRLVPDGTAPEALQRVHRLKERQDAFESGHIPEAEFIAWASEQLGFTGSADSFCDAWQSIFEPIPAMWESIAAMKAAGLSLYLFSNTNSIHARWFLNSYEVMTHFDGAILSHEVGALKPDPAIYEIALRTHGLRPETTLYVDDLPENIATGEAMGLLTHQYQLHQHAAFSTWLNQHLG